MYTKYFTAAALLLLALVPESMAVRTHGIVVVPDANGAYDTTAVGNNGTTATAMEAGVAYRREDDPAPVIDTAVVVPKPPGLISRCRSRARTEASYCTADIAMGMATACLFSCGLIGMIAFFVVEGLAGAAHDAKSCVEFLGPDYINVATSSVRVSVDDGQWAVKDDDENILYYIRRSGESPNILFDVLPTDVNILPMYVQQQADGDTFVGNLGDGMENVVLRHGGWKNPSLLLNDELAYETVDYESNGIAPPYWTLELSNDIDTSSTTTTMTTTTAAATTGESKKVLKVVLSTYSSNPDGYKVCIATEEKEENGNQNSLLYSLLAAATIY